MPFFYPAFCPKGVLVMIMREKCMDLSIFYAVLLCAALICIPSISWSAEIHVDDDTCPSTGSGTAADPYCHIYDAINAAVSGDDVLVHPGTYAERIYMKTGVDVLAAEAEKPVVTSSFKTIVKFYLADNCTLDGFVLDGSSSTKLKAAIIIEDGCTNVAVKNCTINGGSYLRGGIRMNGQVVVTIEGNTIYDFSYSGITTKWGGTISNSTLTIQGNTIEDCGTAGIYLAGASGTSNRVIIGGSNVSDGNLIQNNGAGSSSQGSGIRLYSIDQVSIENNTIQGNRRAGILLIDTSSVSPHIAGNSIHDNRQAGINIGGTSTLTIGTNNDIYNNSIAGITFFVFRNSLVAGYASSQPVEITGNFIHANTKAGISVIDNVTGAITINGNQIYENGRSGIAFFNACSATITDNDIYSHTGAAGIFTGDWSGTFPPDPDNPPTNVQFNTANGPVQLTIRRNKIYGNRAGMRLDHASGVITNNLVYNNSRGGIRFSGNSISPYTPFSAAWGISEISNNTVVSNGSYVAEFDEDRGGGIVYDDISITTDPDTGLARNFYDRPQWNSAQAPHIIKNNIAAWNIKAGVHDTVCSTLRDYNLYYGNNGKATFAPAQTGGCANGAPPNFTGNPNELFADPLFVDSANGDYHLQAGSPAIGSGDDGNDLGAYGGADPITW